MIDFRLKILLTFLLALPIVSTDIYLPSLKSVSYFFQVSFGHVQLTLTLYFFIFGIVQIFYGVLSDYMGRKPMILISLVIYITATCVCIFSTNIKIFILGRCFQAVGAGSAILIFAIVRDLYEGELVAKLIAYMSAVVALSPVIAPIIGGYVQTLLSWEWDFVILAIMGIVLLIGSCWILPETHKPNVIKILNYVKLLVNSHYIFHALAAAFAFGALFAYVSGAPYVLLNVMGYSPLLFSLIFSLAALGYVLGAFVNGRLMCCCGMNTLSWIGMTSLVSGSVMILLALHFYPQNGLAIVLPQIVCEFGISIVVSISTAKALQTIPQCAGAGSALLGFLRFLFAGISSYCVMKFHPITAFPLVLTIIGFSLLSLSNYFSIYLFKKERA